VGVGVCGCGDVGCGWCVVGVWWVWLTVDMKSGWGARGGELLAGYEMVLKCGLG